MTNTRKKLIFTIGTNDNVTGNLEIAKYLFSRHYGGITASVKTGAWFDDGDEEKELYTGNYISESSYCLELIVMPDQVERAIEHGKKIIGPLFSGVATWIQVEIIDLHVAHFQI